MNNFYINVKNKAKFIFLFHELFLTEEFTGFFSFVFLPQDNNFVFVFYVINYD